MEIPRDSSLYEQADANRTVNPQEGIARIDGPTAEPVSGEAQHTQMADSKNGHRTQLTPEDIVALGRLTI